VDGSDIAAWLASLLFLASALLGWVLRRFASGGFIQRMRPHFVVGYAVLALAVGHALLSFANTRSISSADLWVAVVALAGLLFQAFLGLSLQAPGAYRAPLRRWHTVAFWAIAVLIIGHILLTV